jgi:hypothetical protein
MKEPYREIARAIYAMLRFEQPANGDQSAPRGYRCGNAKWPAETGRPFREVSIHDVHRAGDGTRTHDVQLGKRTENNASASYVVDSQVIFVQSGVVHDNELARTLARTVTNGNQR